MLRTSTLIALIWVILCATLSLPQSTPAVIRGTLRDQGRPIQSAQVYLQSLQNEHCASLFTTTRKNWKKEQELERCVRDESSVLVDQEGHFRFAGLKPGWYVIHFLWNITEKPSRPDTGLLRDGWGVIYAGRTDSTGRFDTIAQDKPFYFSGKEDVVRDFDNRP